MLPVSAGHPCTTLRENSQLLVPALTMPPTAANRPGENELDVMFDVMKQDAETLWRTRLAVAKQRDNFNARAKTMITDWLAAKGLKPDPNAAKASKQVVSAKDLPQETPTAAALAAVELLNKPPLNTAGVTKSAGPLKRHHRPNAARRRKKLNQHNN